MASETADAGRSDGEREKQRLVPLRRANVDSRGRPLAPVRAKAVTALTKAWKDALSVTPHDVAGFIPTERELSVAEALLDGQLTPSAIQAATDLTLAEVKSVFGDPVAMAWISRQIDQLCQHRLGLVDAAMFARAVAGDVTAAKLVYERVGKIRKLGAVNVFSHGNTQINLSGLSNDDLKKLIAEDERTLALSAGASVPGAEGADEASEGGAGAVLHAPLEAGGVSQSAEDVPPEADAGREQER